MLDAGEGTHGQLLRHFGPDGIDDVLRSIRLIFISHMHADHNAGLAAVVGHRRRLADAPPLTIVCPLAIRISLRDLAALEDLGLDSITFALHSDSEPSDPGLGLSEIRSVPVKHRAPNCYGLVVSGGEGGDRWRVVFSGDTMPCEALVTAGRDATLLIHEATMDDAREEMARTKAHSTFGQAIDIGTRMRARNVLLTHFSQRYPKLPSFDVGAADAAAADGRSRPHIALAFDLMSFRVGDMWKFAHWTPALQTLFSELDTDAVPAEEAEMAHVDAED